MKVSEWCQIYGQTPPEDMETNTYFNAATADDRILHTCLGILRKNSEEAVVLLTEDRNLANKAIICKVETFRSEDIEQGLS